MSRQNDDEDPEQERPRNGGGSEGGHALAVLSALGPMPDLETLNLRDLMEQVYDFAEDTFREARRESGNPIRQGQLLKQGLALATGYARLVAMSDNHRKAIG